MSNLDQAISIAIRAHFGQIDKAGRPYILHPIRVMLKFQSEQQMIVAVMHDVIEDSSITIDDLRSFGFSETVIDAIVCLTKNNGESYEDFVSRVSNNDLARIVKIEDIKDNLDLTRIDKITDKDLARTEKYHRALRLLIERSS